MMHPRFSLGVIVTSCWSLVCGLSMAQVADPQDDAVESLIQKAEKLRDSGDKLAAAEVFEEASRLFAQQRGAEHWKVRGLALAAREHRQEAMLSREDQNALEEGFRLDDKSRAAAQKGDHKAAAELSRKALEVLRRVLGDNHGRVARAHESLAVSLWNCGRREEAIEEYKQAAALYGDLVGRSHFWTRKTNQQIGVSLMELERPQEALPFAKELLDGCMEESEDKTSLAHARVLFGQCLRETNHPEQAVPLLRQAIEFYNSTTPPDATQVARASGSLARCFIDMKKYDEAERVARAGFLAMKDRGYKPHYALVCLEALAVNLENQNKTTQTVPIYRALIMVASESRGEDDPFVHSQQDKLSLTLMKLGRFKEAEPILRTAWERYRKQKGDCSPEHYYAMTRLGQCLDELGQTEEGERLMREALDGLLAAEGALPEAIVDLRLTLGTCLSRQGRDREAETLIREALELAVAREGSEALRTAECLSSLASCLRDLGRWAEAERHARRALAIFDKHHATRDSSHFHTLRTLAETLDLQGRHGEADEVIVRMARFAMDAGSAQSGESASLIVSIARGASNRQQWDKAEQRYQKALTMLINERGVDHPTTLRAQMEYGEVLSNLGKLQEAERLLRETLQRAEKSAGRDILLVNYAQQALARTLIRQRKFDEAEVLMRKAVDGLSHSLGYAHPDALSAQFFLGMALEGKGQRDEALDIWSAMAETLETARGRIAAMGLERAQRETWRIEPLVAIALARRGRTREAWQRWERGLSRGLLDELQIRRARAISHEDRKRRDELLKELRSLDERIQRQSELITEDKSPLRARRNDVAAQGAAFQQELDRRYGASESEVCNLQDLQRALHDGEALIGWVDDYRSLFVCLVRKKGDPEWVEIRTNDSATRTGQNSAIREGAIRLVRSLRGEFELGDKAEPVESRCADFANSILGPILPRLGDLKRLIVVPSPVTDGIPLEVLLSAAVKDKAPPVVSYAPSASVLVYLRNLPGSAAKPERLLCVGDVEFDTEAKRVAALFPSQGVDLLVGNQATEERFEKLAHDVGLTHYSHLHFSTHGKADERSPLRSAILLVRTPRINLPLFPSPKFDGLITASQILQSWRLEAELVTLSACETGLGAHRRGEGYLGFAQALLCSGSKRVVLSMWPVEAHATCLLMVRFYENLLGKRPGLEQPMSTGESLDEAKQWLRGLNREEAERLLKQQGFAANLPFLSRGNAEEKPFAAPQFWAPFILIGEPD